MPAKRKPNDPPQPLRVLLELHIEMEPEDTPEQWMAALRHDFLPQLPGVVSVLDPPPDPPPTVEEPHATDPQFPHVIENPDIEMRSYRIDPPAGPQTVTISLVEKLGRISIVFRGASLPWMELDLSPGTAAELGTQLLYARDKLTGRR